MRKMTFAMLATAAFISSGCSTLTADGTSQDVTIFTYDGKSQLPNANCDLKNDEGAWTAVTPATLMVHRSNKDLLIKCTKDGYDDGHTNVESKTKTNMWGNIIFGGGVGAIIDHNNGSAYDYPSTINVPMKKKNDE